VSGFEHTPEPAGPGGQVLTAKLLGCAATVAALAERRTHALDAVGAAARSIDCSLENSNSGD
jgi:hypothetical protein